MRRVFVHGILLVVMLLTAFVTWTGADRETSEEAAVEVWKHDPDDVASVTYRSSSRSVHMERRGRGDEAHVWAVQTDSTPAALDSVAPQARAQVTEYPVGEQGITLLEGLARLRGVRDLGEATAARRATYGFSDTVPVVTLRLRNGTEHTLALGMQVPGGVSRYVQDVERNRIHVIPTSALRSLETGGDMLRLTKMQNFKSIDVARVTVRAGTVERTMHRRAPNEYTRPSWTQPGSDRHDEEFVTFMDQIDQLWAARFITDAAADTLQHIVRIDYFDSDDDPLGFIDLFRTRGAGEPVYLIRTRQTIVLAEVYPGFAQRIEQDITTLFRSNTRGAVITPPSPRATQPS